MATVSERTRLVAAPEKQETASYNTQDRSRGRSGMKVPRVFSVEGSNPFEQVEWEKRTAEIKDERGRAIFQQTDCEVPQFWSQLATNVVASKYFYGDLAGGNGCPSEGKREYSVRQLIDRVTRTIADWGREDGYFASADDADRFSDELTARETDRVSSSHRQLLAGPDIPYWWNRPTLNQTGELNDPCCSRHRAVSSSENRSASSAEAK